MAIKGSTFSADFLTQRPQTSTKFRRERQSREGGEDAVALREDFGKSKRNEAPEQSNPGRGKRRRIQDEIVKPEAKPAPREEASIQPTPAEPTPVTGVKPSEGESSIKSLSARYVQQYEQQSGRTLSSSERSSLEQEVQEFYSEPSRSGRLEQIVFEQGKELAPK
jgi:hypothetical protein